ncbi:hypothetical protein U9M48_041376 [Paspalum notatum var. saurae]|uniref:Uncharacterized protein n=1 Tax=Paspalum notatum var. saurae TaxID=547442 RepID=A0AAQ3UT06_PASNO
MSGMTPMPKVVHPGQRRRRTIGRRGGSASGGVSDARPAAAVVRCPARTMPYVYGGVAGLRLAEEALVVLLDAAAASAWWRLGPSASTVQAAGLGLVEIRFRATPAANLVFRFAIHYLKVMLLNSFLVKCDFQQIVSLIIASH